MMSKIMLVVSMLLGASGEVTAAPAKGEPPVRSRSPNPEERAKPLSVKEAALAAHEFTKCVVNRRERDVHTFLSTDEGGSTLAQLSLQAQNDCVRLRRDHQSLRVNFPLDLLRGLIAEHWLKKSNFSLAIHVTWCPGRHLPCLRLLVLHHPDPVPFASGWGGL